MTHDLIFLSTLKLILNSYNEPFYCEFVCWRSQFVLLLSQLKLLLLEIITMIVFT